LKYDSVGIPVFTAICDTVKCWCHCTKALPVLIFYQWCGWVARLSLLPMIL